MIPVELDDITLADIQRLMTEGVQEGVRIDYKRAAVGGRDADRVEFLTDVTSFANAAGGDIIYGVTENGGVPTAVEGLPEVVNADAEVLRLNSMILNGIEPRLTVGIRAITGASRGPIVVIRVPRGWFGLHMVRVGGSQRFYGRTNAGKMLLDAHQIRAGFLAGAEIADRARMFKDERLARLLAGELPVALDEPRAVVLHVIPVASLADRRELIDILRARRSAQVLPLYPSAGDLRYNIDGILAVGDATYGTLYYSGIYEGVSGQLIRERIPSTTLAVALVETLTRYFRLAEMLSIQPPLFVFCTLYGVANRVFALSTEFGAGYYARAFDREVVSLPSVLVEDVATPAPVALRPMFDVLWRAVGAESCDLYDAAGNWRPR